MIKEQVAEILLKIKAVTLSPNKPYKFTSGIISPIYCDNRLLMSYPEERLKIRDFFIETIKDNNINFDIIAGTATSGIPHAAWLADKLEKPMIYVRAKAKEHGKENLIEGKLEKGQKVLVIEDLFSTGGSSAFVVKALQDAGCLVEFCLAIFSYELKQINENFTRLNCTPIALSNFSTLIDIAVKNNYIKEKDKKKVLEWSKDPWKWRNI
jgi:orotate phosphoribosyltransferase